MRNILFVLLSLFLFPALSPAQNKSIEKKLDEINRKLDSILEHQKEWDDWFVEVLLADRTNITQYRKAHTMTTEQLYRRWDYPKKYQDLIGRVFGLKNKEDQDLWKRLSPVRKAEFRKFLSELQK